MEDGSKLPDDLKEKIVLHADYHKAEDDDEKINFDGMLKQSGLLRIFLLKSMIKVKYLILNQERLSF